MNLRTNRTLRSMITGAVLAGTLFAGASAAGAQPNNNSDTRWTQGQVKSLCSIGGGTYFDDGRTYGCFLPDGTVLYCWASDNQCISFARPPKGNLRRAAMSATAGTRAAM